jgi:hypothetical protein
MKIVSLTLLAFAIAAFSANTFAQKHRPAVARKPSASAAMKPREIGSTAVVMDETLSVLRVRPSLFAEVVQRMHRGRKVQILGVAEGDGVKFYKVSAPPSNAGWVQADAVFGKFRVGDEERLARFVQASSGFDQVELAAAFFEMYPVSQFRPAILLLFGDILEETAVKLSRDAASRLDRHEMAATAAPMHSYYLNFVSIDRYRKLGIQFLFDPATRTFHYDGKSWKELASEHPGTNEATEAKKRLDSLAMKMGTGSGDTSGGKK